MILVPNSYGSPVLEMNTCHAPTDGKFCTKGGASVTFENLHTDEYKGENYYTLVARDSTKASVGTVDYSTYQGAVHVKMARVSPERQRQGIGLGLLRQLAKEHPGVPIHPGMTTPEGEKLWRAYDKDRRRERLKTPRRRLPLP